MHPLWTVPQTTSSCYLIYITIHAATISHLPRHKPESPLLGEIMRGETTLLHNDNRSPPVTWCYYGPCPLSDPNWVIPLNLYNVNSKKSRSSDGSIIAPLAHLNGLIFGILTLVRRTRYSISDSPIQHTLLATPDSHRLCLSPISQARWSTVIPRLCSWSSKPSP